MKKIFFIVVIMVMALGFSLEAQAALQNLGTDTLGNQLIYDSDLDITWYDYVKSPNLWQDQMNWASTLTVSGGDLVGVYNDWRLPTALNQNGTGPCSGYNCTGSEMGHLYYTELGNTSESGLINKGAFLHLQNGVYWSGTASSMPFQSWNFRLSDGNQGSGVQFNSNFSAIAVHPGQVESTGALSAPEPISSTLFIVGGAMGFWRFRKKSRI